jgi:hypothetical protein
MNTNPLHESEAPSQIPELRAESKLHSIEADNQKGGCMKTLKQSVLVTGALLLGAGNLAALGAQEGNGWVDQWYQAKFGRNSPITEARMRANQANAAYREEVKAMPANTWFEDFWRAKYGHSSPMAQADVAFREETGKAVMPANTWLEDFSRAKYGRSPR